MASKLIREELRSRPVADPENLPSGDGASKRKCQLLKSASFSTASPAGAAGGFAHCDLVGDFGDVPLAGLVVKAASSRGSAVTVTCRDWPGSSN
jgi:hypothetical protein